MKTVNFLFISCCLLLVTQAAAQNNAMDTAVRYIKVPAGYLMVLRQGEDVLAQIGALAEKENIPSANFAGMGFVNARFGFFNFETKEYEPKQFDNVELASMRGSIAWQNGKVSIHAHGVVTDRQFKAWGGHMLHATVGTGSVEVLITVHDKKLERKMEDPPGANVLQLSE